MMLKPWDQLPDYMRTDAVRPYYDVLKKRQGSLLLKRIFDFLVALILLLIIWPILIIIAIAVRLDSPGPAFFRQVRVTTYGRKFRMWKYRTMVANADKMGPQVTTNNDMRITRIGKILRGVRLDELPQLINILVGDMSFVGTRPEVVKYVEAYQPEYYATLLTPAGVTSEASIRYKDEYELLEKAEDADKVYIEEILPAKMVWNLESIERFRFLREILTIIRTVLAVLGKDYQ